MSKRGRPRTPDVLTPREWLVLDLIREGLGNREIAERLEISLSGAKHHVSEIISKLGVTSREEASAWQGENRRAYGRLLPPVVRAGKATAVVISVLVVAAVFVLLTAGWLPGRHQAPGNAKSSSTPVEGMATPFTNAGGNVLILNKLEEVRDAATFPVLLLSRIPPGFVGGNVIYMKPDFGCPADLDPIWCARAHNDWMTISYSSKDGWLDVTQGYGGQYRGFSSRAPESARGKVTVNGKEAEWVRGQPRPGASPLESTILPESAWDLTGPLAVIWLESVDANPSGGMSPHYISVSSNSLSLGELLDVARSLGN